MLKIPEFKRRFGGGDDGPPSKKSKGIGGLTQIPEFAKRFGGEKRKREEEEPVEEEILDSDELSEEAAKIAQQSGAYSINATTILDEFEDMGEYTKDSLLVTLIGKRNTGKTTMVTNILYRLRDLYAYGWIICPTKVNHHYQQFMPNECIITDMDDEFFDKLTLIQSTRIHRKGANSRVFVVIDDMAHKITNFNKALAKLAFIGRHYNIDLYFIAQVTQTNPKRGEKRM